MPTPNPHLQNNPTLGSALHELRTPPNLAWPSVLPQPIPGPCAQSMGHQGQVSAPHSHTRLGTQQAGPWTAKGEPMARGAAGRQKPGNPALRAPARPPKSPGPAHGSGSTSKVLYWAGKAGSCPWSGVPVPVWSLRVCGVPAPVPDRGGWPLLTGYLVRSFRYSQPSLEYSQALEGATDRADITVMMPVEREGPAPSAPGFSTPTPAPWKP